MREQWSEISENLKKMLHSGVFKVWIAPLQAQVHAGGLLLTAPNAFVASWLEGKMLATLREAAAPVLGLEPAAVDVRIVAATEANPAVPSALAADTQPVANGHTSMIMPGAPAQPSAALQFSGAAYPAATSNTEADSFAHASAVLSTAFSGLAAGAAQPSAYQDTVASAPLSAARPQLQGTLPISSTPAYRLATNWRYSFADFVVGPTNNMAVAAAQDGQRVLALDLDPQQSLRAWWQGRENDAPMMLADGTPRETLTAALLHRLYGAGPELWHHPQDGRPLVV